MTGDSKKTTRAADGAAARRCEEILDAAAQLFAERGFDASDTQELIARLQVGKGTVYKYFPSKRELFLAAVDRVMRRLKERIDGDVEGLEDPLLRIERAVESFFRFFDDHPGFVELLIQERALFKDRAKPTYLSHCEENVGPWRALYRRLIDEGRVRDMPVERITMVLSDLLYGTIFTHYFGGRRQSFFELSADVLDLFFNGILTDAERKKRSVRGAPKREKSPAAILP